MQTWKLGLWLRWDCPTTTLIFDNPFKKLQASNEITTILDTIFRSNDDLKGIIIFKENGNRKERNYSKLCSVKHFIVYW